MQTMETWISTTQSYPTESLWEVERGHLQNSWEVGAVLLPPPLSAMLDQSPTSFERHVGSISCGSD
jgi:hypothetical protein